MKKIMDWLKGKPSETGPDGYPVAADDPYHECQQKLSAYMSEVASSDKESWRWETDPKKYNAGRAILDIRPEHKVRMVHAITNRIAYLASYSETVRHGDRIFHFPRKKDAWRYLDIYSALASAILRKKLPFEEEDFLSLLMTASTKSELVQRHIPMKPFLSQIERYVKEQGLSAKLRGELERLKAVYHNAYQDAETREIIDRTGDILGDDKMSSLEQGEKWSEAISSDLGKMDEPARSRWKEIVEHAFQAGPSRPTKKWLQEAGKRLSAVDRNEFRGALLSWFSLVSNTGGQLMSDRNGALLKGLVWYCCLFDEDEVARALSDVAVAAFRKISGMGPRAQKVGNACINVLASVKNMNAVAQLGRLKIKIKYRKVQELIDKALEQAAVNAGLAKEDLEERAVPTFGLEGDGVMRRNMGGFTAELRITGRAKTELSWHRDDGKTQKSVPAEIRRDFSDEVADLKRTAKDIESMLPAQARRIEELFLAERSWTIAVWRERYLDHPLLSRTVRRLIWHFKLGERTGLGMWHEGRFIDAQWNDLDWLTDDVQVSLWHPIGFDVDTIRQWRVLLEDRGITQPFKQAHREVYILTDAEISTRTYSNRFAAHILKQHQLSALCRQRGWAYQLQGCFDSFSMPTLELPRWGLRVEYWVESVSEDSHMTESGIYLYVSTDQVRFYNTDAEQLPLSEVPAMVFSEVMRDVDLFVGVCSVGNDQAWEDSGEGGGYVNYWRTFSFGDLSASAQTRKEVLERLLPRLKIGGQCSIDGKFLVVRGSMRTYKIHLGSGNILMEPNDQYLCIVADKGFSGERGKEKVLLPFEGDTMFSVILSKAFLLADDGKIEDRTILNQIEIMNAR